MANAPAFDYKKYLRLIDDHRLLFMGVALAVMTAFTVVCYLLPKKYEAKSTVFIEENIISSLVAGIAITPSLEAKIRVLKIAMLSRSLLKKVMDELDLDLRASTPVDKEALLQRLQKTTNVSLNEGRGVFTISFMDTEPVLARDYVNTLIRKYIEENTASKREESVSATRFLAEQIAHFRERVDKIDAEIQKFKQEKGPLLAMEAGTLLSENARAEEKLTALAEKRRVIEAQRNLMARSNVYIEDSNLKTVPGATDSNAMVIQQLESQLASLRTRFTDKHPSVVQTLAQIEKLKAPAAPEAEAKAPDAPKAEPPQNGAKAGGVENTPQFELLQLELTALEQQEKQLQAGISRNNELLQQLPVVQAEMAELAKRKENENSIYEQLVARYGKSEVSKQMELQDKVANFRVIDAAITPTKPVSPNRVMLMAMGIGLGLGLAMGLVVLLDFLDDRIRSPQELKPLKLAVMAVVPAMDDPNVENLRKVDYKAYACGAVWFACILAILGIEFLGLDYMDRVVSYIPLQQLLRGAKALIGAA